MRIIGGKYGGRKFILPSGFKARPTTDYARESLFNILNNRIDFKEIYALDLFAGTGSISYEFASRGVREVHLVEQDKKHIAGIRRIINDIGFTNIKSVHLDVKGYLKICRMKYDIVFADPPYDLKWLKDIPDTVLASGIINEDGFLILEHPGNIRFNDHKLFFEHRNYGGVNFSFFKAQ